MNVTDVWDFTNTTEYIIENDIDELIPVLFLSIPSGVIVFCLLRLTT